MTRKLIYKNESIKKFKSEFKKKQNRVYTSFRVDRNTKYKGLNLCEYKNEKKYPENQRQDKGLQRIIWDLIS